MKLASAIAYGRDFKSSKTYASPVTRLHCWCGHEWLARDMASTPLIHMLLGYGQDAIERYGCLKSSSDMQV